MYCIIILPLFLQYLTDIEDLISQMTYYFEIHIGVPQ
jgi:hypothetical protein